MTIKRLNCSLIKILVSQKLIFRINVKIFVSLVKIFMGYGFFCKSK
jgi:hypothetical protein